MSNCYSAAQEMGRGARGGELQDGNEQTVNHDSASHADAVAACLEASVMNDLGGGSLPNQGSVVKMLTQICPSEGGEGSSARRIFPSFGLRLLSREQTPVEAMMFPPF